MGAFVALWLVGEGIVIYRTAKQKKAPPGPGQLLFTSGAFVILALLAEFPSARKLAITLALGYDIAAFMNVIPLGPNKAGEAAASQWPPNQAPDTLVFPDGTSGPTAQGVTAPGKNLPGK